MQSHEGRSPETVVLAEARQNLETVEAGYQNRPVEGGIAPVNPQSRLGDAEGTGQRVCHRYQYAEEGAGLAAAALHTHPEVGILLAVEQVGPG